MVIAPGSLHRRRGFETVAAAEGRDFQVEGRVSGVVALVDHVLGGFVGGADLDDLLGSGVHFAEMDAQPALSVMDFVQEYLRFSLWRATGVPRLPASSKVHSGVSWEAAGDAVIRGGARGGLF